MRMRWAAVLAAAISLAAGCGNPVGTGTTSAVPLSGNWEFSVPTGMSIVSGLPLLVSGSLEVNGNNVSADFLAGFITQCVGINTPDIVFTGTVNKSNISLTSTAWAGTVFTITGTVSSDGQSLSGNWSGKGGCADGQSNIVDLQYIPAVTGKWSGVLGTWAVPGATAVTPGGLGGATITVQLQQSPTPTQYSFPLTGTITVSGSTCGFSTGTLVQANPIVPLAPSSISGPVWIALATMDDGSEMTVEGVLGPTTGQWTAFVTVAGGTCNDVLAEAPLTGA